MFRPYRGQARRARSSRKRWVLARVHGLSMVPTLAAGDLLLVRRGRPARVGDLLVVRLPDGTEAVKRAAFREGHGWWVERDNPRQGVDSWTVGVIAEQDVTGVVLARLWPRPGPLRSLCATRRRSPPPPR